MTNEKWKSYLVNTKEKNINYERLDSLKDNKSNLVYEYILRCLDILDKDNVSEKVYNLVSETIKWSDVSKCGTREDREKWKSLGFNLIVHNIASSDIYKLDNKDYNEVVRVLIKTHGLIGQYIRGEVNLSESYELYKLIEKGLIDKRKLEEVLIVLNKCIVGAVNMDLYNNIELEINECVERIINNDFDEKIDVKDKLRRLNNGIIDNTDVLNNEEVIKRLEFIFGNIELWYYSSALSSFKLEEQVKILLIIYNKLNDSIHHISFNNMMKNIYLDYKNKKITNIYKTRIIEQYLKSLDINDIINNKMDDNIHVNFDIKKCEDMLEVDFKFSLQAEKLIEFCEVAYVSDSLYNKAVYMLYELFGFRRDEYDRFYNEIDYLSTMNSSLNSKRIILDFINGKSILDVGPGGGALMDLIESEFKDAKVLGIDISKNVIDALNEKKIKENHKWEVTLGDALNLNNYYKKGEVDTIIYSSIIHELYSYIPFNGKKFNIDTVKSALKSAWSILDKGGRIIIRDGIKTEPEDVKRVIKFKNKEDMKILDRYSHDFKGRKVTYDKIREDTVKMLVNDAMEFLYTYTWGENSYSLEVKEQFGYLTPSEYVNLVNENLEGSKIVYTNHFLQDGYEENLLNKISIYDENMNVVKLPDSTFILVIEKE